jgi:apolipoprotein N-acyltransferase
MCVALLLNEALRTNTLAQMRTFGALFLAPEAASWCVLFLFSAQASIDNGSLVLTRGARRLELALDQIGALQLWRLPIPGPGICLRLASGRRWRYALATANPHLLAGALAAAGAAPVREPARAVMQAYVQAGLATRRSWLDHPLAKFVLLPLALAIPAFHLQQQIAYGGPFGEYYTFGLKAYLTAFAIWWAAWSIGVVLSQAVLRAAIETGTLLAALLRPARAAAIRQGLESIGHAALFLGLPGWLLLTVYRA